ncbi:PorP/SprF family type IX secretion system membrane protein [Mucilaginibacter terrae]|uniref:Type IX secretion system PorP/SprF family membrane protein n=1 Tax=Mucilaginibacter terrae TaxID=1955052 RepID=A0ABU3GQ34_9SPHI|nr:type IX secretion system membrane protein PorP/SprF [Mucilaginibacter terrae]MDT3401893.1 type IX secretion system PorP/SprF family membrane protein [Mucilaginibacter terrae]
MNKKILLSLIAVMFNMVLMAQQKPQYTQYIFNQYLLNPAVTGIENYTDFKAGYRSQWTGLEGAPVTSYLSVNAPIGQNFIYGDATSMAGPSQNPMSRQANRDYISAEPHHGLGGMVVTDRSGPITQTTLSGTYAYHLGISGKLNLSVGVSAGVNRIALDLSQVRLQDPNDAAIYSGNTSQWRPDLGVGVWAYSGNFYAGASVQQLIKQTITFGDRSKYNQGKTVPHYFLTGGVKLYLGEDVTMMPSLLFKLVEPTPLNYDVNCKIAFSNKFWVGAAYRHNDSKSAMMGVNISSVINLGYSYDFTSSNLRTVSNGTHEFVLGILLNNRYDASGPVRVW